VACTVYLKVGDPPHGTYRWPVAVGSVERPHGLLRHVDAGNPQAWGSVGPMFASCLSTPWTACARHGITGQLYWQMMYAQQGVCAICHQCATHLGEVVPLGIDHDHDCCDAPAGCPRCVRGLLCSPCGGWLGAYERRIAFPGVGQLVADRRSTIDAYLAMPTARKICV
jgi:hypothetical protein